MGIDARMHFIPSEPLSEEVLKELDYGLASTVRANFFGRFGSYICLTRAEDLPEPAIEVHLAGRYYGEGYERGPLTSYLEIADWLELKLSGVSIFYYGDSGGEEVQKPFDKAERARLYAYYLQHGGNPYQRFFGEGPKGCKCCVRPLVNTGGGGGDKFYRCLACRENFVQEASGRLLRVNDVFKRDEKTTDYTGF